MTPRAMLLAYELDTLHPHRQPMTRRIIQIAPSTFETAPGLFALCEDGTVWFRPFKSTDGTPELHTSFDIGNWVEIKVGAPPVS
jgi:hypothetical protein